MLWVSRGPRPGMPLNVVHHTGQSSTTKNYPNQNARSWKTTQVEKS